MQKKQKKKNKNKKKRAGTSERKKFYTNFTESRNDSSYIKSTETRWDETQLMEYHNCYPMSIEINDRDMI